MASEAHEFVIGSGDLPEHVAEALSTYVATAEVLGRRTGELHMQLASATEPAFAPESYTRADLERTGDGMRHRAAEELALLETRLPSLEPRPLELAQQVLAHRAQLLQAFDSLGTVHGAARIRCHGDYHLGQVLITEGDVVILDFEGEPARPIEERRAKSSPLRDVAGMLRSFSYAAFTALNAATLAKPDALERLAPWAELWETWVSAIYLRAYLAATRDSGLLPSQSDELETLLQAFMVSKALYELGYELNNRPDWAHVPLAGLLRLRSPLHA